MCKKGNLHCYERKLVEKKVFFRIIFLSRQTTLLFVPLMNCRVKARGYNTGSQSYETLISSFFRFLLLSLDILKYRQYFLILQTLKLNNKKRGKSSFYDEKSLVGLTPGPAFNPPRISTSSLFIILQCHFTLPLCTHTISTLLDSQ